MTPNLAIYIHWPYCKSKCPYCDFNSHVSNSINHDQWRKAYIKEIEHFADYIARHNISSIFFGGGTPTLMEPETASLIISKLQSLGRFSNDIEITLEGNPTSVEAAKLRDFKDAGVNRISLGVQSLISKDLQFLGREHSPVEALNAVETASQIFDNYSFDLIYARPEQTLNEWQDELQQALKYARNHLSLYQLSIEKGTPFFSDYSKGVFKIPDEDLAADFYLLTREIMEQAGMPAYEISNHAKAGFESRHNLSYWRYDDYLGIGPGAHSRISVGNAKRAMMMTSQPDNWLTSIEKHGNAIQVNTILTDTEITDELIMMGLRIVEGISRERFKNITKYDIEDIIPEHKLDKLLKNQLVELDSTGLRCTKAGMLVVNAIAAELLG